MLQKIIDLPYRPTPLEFGNGCAKVMAEICALQSHTLALFGEVLAFHITLNKAMCAVLNAWKGRENG